METGCFRLLESLTSKEIVDRCFPDKSIKTPPSYCVKMEDINHDGLKIFRPLQDLKYLKELNKLNVFKDRVREMLILNQNKRYRKVYKVDEYGPFPILQ